MTPKEASAGFAALGSEPRLEVLRMLVRAGHESLSISQIQDALGIPASTLAHHLRFLASAGLIEQARDGRTVLSRARFERVEALSEYLLDECCVDASRVSPELDASRIAPEVAAFRIAPKTDTPRARPKTAAQRAAPKTAAPRIVPKISIKRRPAKEETA